MTAVSGVDGIGLGIAGLSGGFFSSLTVTDGTHTVNDVGQLIVSGATISGTSPDATISISGGVGAYQYVQPTTGFSQAINNGVATLVIDPTGTLATGTVIMPTTPADGQILSIKSSQAIAALTIAPAAGQVVTGTMPFSMALGQTIYCIYLTSTTTWFL